MQTKLQAVVLLVLVVAQIACRIPTSLITERAAESVSANQFTLGNEPFFDEMVHGLTDHQGETRFDSIDGDYTLQVETRSQETDHVLPAISVWVTEKQGKFLVIAIDESGEYAPFVREYTAAELSSLKTARPAQSGALLTILVYMAAALGIYENASQWIDYFENYPRVESWGTFSHDVCINPNQKQQGSQALFGATMILMSPGGALKEADGYLPALGVVFDQLMDEGVDTAISQVLQQQPPAIERWRIYTISSFLFAQFQGYCLEPIDRADLQSALDWVQYGLAHSDPYPFEVILPDTVGTRPELIDADGVFLPYSFFLQEISERLPSQPQCVGVYWADYGFMLWTSNWSPAWDVIYDWGPEFGSLQTQTANMGLQFSDSQGDWRMSFVFFAASKDELEYMMRGPVSPVFRECPG